MTIITNRELKLKMGRPPEGEDPNEVKITQAVTNVDGIINLMTGTFFTQTTITDEYIDCYSMSDNKFKMNESRKIIWCPAPIISLSSIYEDDVLLVENTDYYLYKNQGRIEADGIFSSERRVVKLTGSFGYAAANVPADIKELALLIGQILTGLATTVYMDENGELDATIRQNVPAWVWKALAAKRWTY